MSESLFESLGFETVKNTRIIKTLEKVTLQSGTSVRDAIMTSINIILKLNTELINRNQSSTWNFLNIVITDGDDNCSQTSRSELVQLMATMNRYIPRSCCKTVLVGVGTSRSARSEFEELANAGGENCEVFNISGSEIEDIFNRIQIQVGVLRQTTAVAVANSSGFAVAASQSYTSVVNISKRKFAVIFTLDISPSMDERTSFFSFTSKWKALKQAVRKFLKGMQSDDLVACVLFHEKVWVVTGHKEKSSSCSVF